MTRHLAFIAVGELVINGQLLAGGDVSQGEEIDAFIFLYGFTIGFARMIHQRTQANAIDHSLAICETEKIGGGPLIVEAVGFLASQASAGVFEDPRPFLDRTSGEASAPMDGGGADLKTSDGFEGFHGSNQILPVHGNVVTAGKRSAQYCGSGLSPFHGLDAGRATPPDDKLRSPKLRCHAKYLAQD
jgi:hypothetical protein